MAKRMSLGKRIVALEIETMAEVGRQATSLQAHKP
jgi:hypothetical protein